MSSSSLCSGVTEKIVCQNNTTLAAALLVTVLHEKADGVTLKTSNSTKEVKENLKKREVKGYLGSNLRR